MRQAVRERKLGSDGLDLEANAFTIKDLVEKIHQEVSQIIEAKVVNKELAVPEDRERSALSIYNHKLYDVDALAAKYFLVLATFFLIYSYEVVSQKDTRLVHSPTVPTFFSLILFACIKYTQIKFGINPFEGLGTSLFLSKERKKLCDLEARYHKTRSQTDCVVPFSKGCCFFVSRPLQQAMYSGRMEPMEHDVMLRVLFGIKNGAFDCVSVSGLTILKLIEAKCRFSIERFQEPKNCQEAHSISVVNRRKGSNPRDIFSWNEDCYIVDPWYGICVSVKEIKETPDFFLKYPCVKVAGKTCAARIEQGNDPPEGYLAYVEKMHELLESPQRGCLSSGLDVVFPRL